MTTASRPTVMIVDDDADIRDGLADLLSDEGFQVQTAANGLEALHALRRGELPRVILLDLMMPFMDGYQFLAARREEPSLQEVRVALITASGQLDRSQLEGVTVLRKPIQTAALLDFLDQV
jgi:CheY-like chemotaxis protein